MGCASSPLRMQQLAAHFVVIIFFLGWLISICTVCLDLGRRLFRQRGQARRMRQFLRRNVEELRAVRELLGRPE